MTRLLIVSNRLPITVEQNQGEFVFKASSGGLVSGISSVLSSLTQSKIPAEDHLWIGWPGVEVPEPQQEAVSKRLKSLFKATPVFVAEAMMNRFYHGFCNKLIWPLFHYFPSLVVFEESLWDDYKKVNEIFCQAVLSAAKSTDIVWIHDYHLMLLPSLLRVRLPNLKIGFFLHIPFPSFEIFRLLPDSWRRAVLEGLLGADLVGFHTHDDAQYFLRCVLRILGFEHTLGRLVLPNRLVMVDSFPLGVDFGRFQQAARSEEVHTEVEKLKQNLAGRRAILSLDRLDYTKGILPRLEAFENFLQKHPEWHKKVVLIMVLVPSRILVEQYQTMKKRIDELVGHINGRFGQMDWNPIVYQYRFVDFPTLVALYTACDVALVTPLRDGMNLVAKEYVASRVDKTGVLILSEMAGAARELGEALQINPHSLSAVVAAVHTALNMPLAEQTERMEIMQGRLKQYDVVRWAEDFVQRLFVARHEQERFEARLLSENAQKDLRHKFRVAKNRLLFLDYDGTLVPFRGFAERGGPEAEVYAILARLSALPRTQIVIISGRDRKTLDRWFGKTRLTLVAEHGVWFKPQGGDWQRLKSLRRDWLDSLRPVLQVAADRLPGAFVEEKEYSLAWHYRQADPELASIRQKELLDNLVQLTANIDVQVITGHKVVEVRHALVSKGEAALKLLENKPDFILAMGDDTTDEDLFHSLPAAAFTIRVGMTNTYARFNLRHYSEGLTLLDLLSRESI